MDGKDIVKNAVLEVLGDVETLFKSELAALESRVKDLEDKLPVKEG
jgi:hypothetical protein